MKQGLNYALFGTVVAVAAGLISAYGIPDFAQTESSFASAQLMGHATYTLTDADGNIKAYRQLDNIVVNDGEDCAARMIFSNTTFSGIGAGECYNRSDPFITIAIGNGSTSLDSAVATDDQLQQEHNQTGTGFLRTTDTTPSFTAATAGVPAAVVISIDFTLDTATVGTEQGGSQPASVTVNESSLVNGTTIVPNSGMFSRQTFTDVPVGNGESLTVEWTINIGGTATLGGAEET